MFSPQGEYEFSPEILSGRLAEVVYKDATQKIKGVYCILCLSFLPFISVIGCNANLSVVRRGGVYALPAPDRCHF